ncbi:MAG: nucleoside monophosphate kinase [Patescibacteria group bacterium]
MNPRTIILLGRSGSGKGTQAKLLQEKLEPCLYVYTGDLFRELSEVETVAGKKVKEVLSIGGLPDEWLAAFLWQKSLVYNLKNNENIIIDGSPRRLDEAEEMDIVLKWLGRVDIKVMLIDITEDEAVTRLLKRARNDDTEDSIRSRLQWFNTEAALALEYFEKSGRLIKINGLGAVEEVFDRIKQALDI